MANASATGGVLTRKKPTSETSVMRQNRSFAILSSLGLTGAGAALTHARYQAGANVEAVEIGFAALVLALIVASAIQVAAPRNRALILGLGQFRSLRGPGLFFVGPVLDAIPYWIDTRVITTGFKAEKTPTKDTVPVDVNAVPFWKVGTRSRRLAEHYGVRNQGVGRTTDQTMRDRLERLT